MLQSVNLDYDLSHSTGAHFYDFVSGSMNILRLRSLQCIVPVQVSIIIRPVSDWEARIMMQ